MRRGLGAGGGASRGERPPFVRAPAARLLEGEETEAWNLINSFKVTQLGGENSRYSEPTLHFSDRRTRTESPALAEGLLFPALSPFPVKSPRRRKNDGQFILSLPQGLFTWQYLNMGNLLKVLTCTDLEQGPNFFLDFENAQPTESEKEIYNQVNVVLKDAEGILEDLQSYRGAGHEIREAIQHPADEKLQEKAWGAVVPLVGKLKKFYEFSQRLEAALRGLLGALTSTPYSPTQHLEREQALAKQFAEILHFTLRFDELKMTNPAIQNDFSYYRRTLSRMRINNVPAEGENEVNNELANRMSLFYAEATPMLKTLSDATTKFVSENKNLPIENTTDCLSTMASVCRVMLETPEYRSRFTNEETVSFCLRVMVGVIILYDHVHPVGAFAKTSKIDMKGCIKVLKDQPPNSVEGLLNALRYTTKHLNDETTSKQIKSMLQ
ncbi:CYFIP-related Rac1 interactor B isoform X1 [Homo sapiens]|uniref:CYFIP-related Rac1 interactor B isoform X1 n=1 Tax=Homo sapiens TaxID=9606 RepID=UPI001FB0C83A|nr:CYFIP-related Rac1 interactor B isoform X1 [Homo sapiens]XP_054216610.1 CYFIP-related Rac1 interactor B isoform X1 [Homo sapiens]